LAASMATKVDCYGREEGDTAVAAPLLGQASYEATVDGPHGDTSMAVVSISGLVDSVQSIGEFEE
jgi:hypothetical protein